MVNGVPAFKEIKYYPSISQHIQEYGYSDMHKVVQLIVQNFCDSLNVVRNMNETQVFEAATYLLDECEGFRIEDYLLMFTMAKRGQFVKIMDRLDITVISSILDNYWITRDAAGKRLQNDEYKAIDNHIDSKNIEFAPAIQEAMTRWLKERDEQKEPEDNSQKFKIAATKFARIMNIPLDKNGKPIKPKEDGNTEKL